MKKISIATAIIATTSGAALAHPGEHAFSIVGSLYHLLTEPDHLVMIAAAVALAAALIYKFKRRSV